MKWLIPFGVLGLIVGIFTPTFTDLLWADIGILGAGVAVAISMLIDPKGWGQ